MQSEAVVIAGITGRLGTLIAQQLVTRGARSVRGLVRRGSSSDTEDLKKLGVKLVEVDYFNGPELVKACENCSCVVSTLSGLEDVIVDVQSQLLDAAVKAGVPRFIPSDYAVDFTKLEDGTNRNFDLRRKFHRRLETAPIAATSILNGMFTDLLTGPAPVILFKVKRVLYWQSADQLLDFTTIENTAEFTAAAAMDPSTPRFLYIGGEQISARGLAGVATDVTGEKFTLLRAGGLNRLRRLIKLMQVLMPARQETFPPWQGMQYLHNMFEGRVKFTTLDNDRYPGIVWTPVRDVIAAREP